MNVENGVRTLGTLVQQLAKTFNNEEYEWSVGRCIGKIRIMRATFERAFSYLCTYLLRRVIADETESCPPRASNPKRREMIVVMIGLLPKGRRGQAVGGRRGRGKRACVFARNIFDTSDRRPLLWHRDREDKPSYASWCEQPQQQ